MALRRPGPGGRNVAAVAVLLACVSGFGFYSLTVYVAYLEDAFGLGVVSRGSALFLLTTGLSGTVVGSLLARLDVRTVLGGGAVLMASGLVLLGRAESPTTLYLAYLLLGLGQAGTGVVPGLTLVTSWFVPPRRATAVTFATTGLSAGGIAVAPVVALALDSASFRSVTTAAAVVFLAVCLVATAAVTPYPVRVGADEAPLDGVTRAAAVRTRAFWTVSAAQTCAALAQIGGLTHLFALVASRGSTGLASQAVSCVAIGSLSGRFLGNAVLRRVPTTSFYRLLLLLQAGALAVLSVAEADPLLLLTSAVFGFTIGNVLLCHPLRLSELFGQRDFARVLALSSLVMTAGTALGPVVVGGLRQASGTWTVAYLTAATVSLTGAVLLSTTRRAPVLLPVPVAAQ